MTREVYSKYTTSTNPGIMNNGGLRSTIKYIIIHHNATTNKNVAMNTWLVSSGNETSAHYEITPTEIIGTLGENYVAWHSGNWDMNQVSIGLEHLNSTGAPTWQVADATLRNSGKLIADICARYHLPINRNTIRLHREVTSTACPGGLDIDKLIRYAREASGTPSSKGVIEINPTPVKHEDKNTSAINTFKNYGNKFSMTKKFRVDEIKKVNGIWQLVNYSLAGGKSINWTLNGIPWAIVDNTSRSNYENVRVGDYVKFSAGWDRGTIDAYDNPSNGVGITYGKYGIIWFDANAVLKL